MDEAPRYTFIITANLRAIRNTSLVFSMKRKLAISFIVVFVFTLSLFVDNALNRKLISEIKDLKEPIGFEKIEVNNIVKKYIPIGISKEQVISLLKRNGFTVVKIKNSNFVKNFTNCDEVLVSVYRIYVFPWPITAYKVVVRICFNGGRATLLKATYVKYIY